MVFVLGREAGAAAEAAGASVDGRLSFGWVR